MVIDAHHHFWNYTPQHYGWISDRMPVLKQDYGPDELKPLLKAAGVDGVVTVHAQQSLAENEWLIALAKQNDFIRGVVGWAPLVEQVL